MCRSMCGGAVSQAIVVRGRSLPSSNESMKFRWRCAKRSVETARSHGRLQREIRDRDRDRCRNSRHRMNRGTRMARTCASGRAGVAPARSDRRPSIITRSIVTMVVETSNAIRTTPPRRRATMHGRRSSALRDRPRRRPRKTAEDNRVDRAPPERSRFALARGPPRAHAVARQPPAITPPAPPLAARSRTSRARRRRAPRR